MMVAGSRLPTIPAGAYVFNVARYATNPSTSGFGSV